MCASVRERESEGADADDGFEYLGWKKQRHLHLIK